MRTLRLVYMAPARTQSAHFLHWTGEWKKWHTHTVVRSTWDDNMALLPLIWHPACNGRICSSGELSLLSIRAGYGYLQWFSYTSAFVIRELGPSLTVMSRPRTSKSTRTVADGSRPV